MDKPAKRFIRSTGPQPSPILFFGEAGGEDEHHRGYAFVGKSGQLFDSYLLRLGFPRPSVRVANMYPYWPGPGNPDPTWKQLRSTEHLVRQELIRTRPKIIVPLGRIAASYFLGSCTMEQVHGVPFRYKVQETGDSVVVLPAYHPAAGLHQPIMAHYCYNDLRQLRRGSKALRSAVWQPASSHLPLAPSDDDLCIDTEGDRDMPWGLSYCYRGLTPHYLRYPQCKGMVFEADRIYLHNSIHDLGMLAAMKVRLEGKILDPMIAAFNTHYEPQGLKDLIFRHGGERRTDYVSLVRPHYNRQISAYLNGAQTIAADPTLAPPRPQWLDRDSDGLYKITSVQPLSQRLTAHLKEAELEDGEPEKLWEKLPLEYREWIEERWGEYPRMSHAIFLVPKEKVEPYVLGDATDPHVVHAALLPRLKKLKLEDVYEMDLAIVPMLAAMQKRGLPFDKPMALALRAELAERVLTIQQTIEDHLSTYINPNSSDQVAAVLFGWVEAKGKDGRARCERLAELTMDLRRQSYFKQGKTRKTKKTSRPSTDDKSLFSTRTRCRPSSPLAVLIDLISKYRETGNLVSKIDSLLEFLGKKDSRIHPNIRLTRVPTGRISTFDPNLLAVPVRTEEGNRIRKCFRAAESWSILSADYSQIELRIMAHESQDKEMMRVFQRREDLHMKTAIEILGSKDKRRAAKCFHPDTEVLTKRGWVKILDLGQGEEVIQAVPKRGKEVELQWTEPLEVFSTKHPSKKLIHFKNEGIDLRVTPDHRMLVYSPRNPRVVLAEDFGRRKGQDWVNAGLLSGGSKSVPERLLRLAVATQADGSYANLRIRFGFSRVRKIRRLAGLLKPGEYRQALHRNGKNGMVTCFTLSRGLSMEIKALLDEKKRFPWWWLELSGSCRRTVLSEVRYWDGTQMSNWRMHKFESTIKQNTDVIQAIASITNLKTRQTTGYLNQLSIKTHNHTRGGNVSRHEHRYTCEVACLSVPSSFVLVRSGGVPVIVGQTVNFAIIYLISPYALLEQFIVDGVYDYTEVDCERIIGEWFKLYKGVRTYHDRVQEEARATGYIRTSFSGRLRRVPNIYSSDRRIREEAERQLGNHPIQGGAGDLIKRGMQRVWRWQRKEKPKLHCLLQIHDELLFEVKDEERKRKPEETIKRLMLADQKLVSVPLEVEAGYGVSWGEAK